MTYLSVNMDVFMVTLQNMLETEALSAASHSAHERARRGMYCCYMCY